MTLPGRRGIRAAYLSAGCLVAGVTGTILAASWHIEAKAAPRLYADLNELPQREAAVVLGTSRHRGKGLNEFYVGRIRAAADLFLAGKVKLLITSGSHPSQYYNEPMAMKRDLIAAGVPPDHIVEDGGGLRTLDSVIRAHSVMGHDAFIVVSQRFHAARAVYIGTSHGLDVVGYCAPDLSGPFDGSITRLREYGARVKAVLDIKVLGTQPTLLDRPVPASYGMAGKRQSD